jgi:hypothetical protein
MIHSWFVGSRYDESAPFPSSSTTIRTAAYWSTYGFEQQLPGTSHEQPEEAICTDRISSNRYKIEDVMSNRRLVQYSTCMVSFHRYIFPGKKIHHEGLDACTYGCDQPCIWMIACVCVGVQDDKINHVSIARLQKIRSLSRTPLTLGRGATEHQM